MKQLNIFLSIVLAASTMLAQEAKKPEEGKTEKGLSKVGKAVDKAAAKTVEVTKEAGKKTVEVTKDAGKATESGAKKAAGATSNAAKKTVEVTKEAGSKTLSATETGLKKTANATESAAKKTVSATGHGMEKAGAAIKGTTQLDVNRASAADLKREMGVSDAQAQKIIQGRPYKMKNQLNSKGILTDAEYEKVKEKIVAKQ